MESQMTFMANGCCILVLALTAVMEGLPPMAALGASPEFVRTEQEQVRLQDSVIEYDETPGLIHEYNAAVQNNQYDYQKFCEDYGDTNSDVADVYNGLVQDSYDDMSGETNVGSMMSDPQLDIRARNMLRQADNTLEDGKIYLLTYEMAEDNLAATAQSNMISYHKKQLELEQKQMDLELAREKHSLEQVKRAADTVMTVGALTAKESLQNSENNIRELEPGIENLKEGLYISLGWKHNDSPDIEELPQMDVSRIDGMDPDRDLETVPENNYTLEINKRKLENARSRTTRESLETKTRSNEKQIGTSLSSAYKNVLSARLSYEQVVAEARLEETNTNIAAGKFQVGMMTSLEYKEQEYKMESSRLDVEIAVVSLFQAMETHDWPVKGLASAEQGTMDGRVGRMTGSRQSRRCENRMGRITGRAEKRRRTGRKRFPITMLFLSLAAELSEVTVLTAAATAQNGLGDTDRQEEYLRQERNEKLEDDVLEYLELQDMVRIYNPTILEVVDFYNKAIMDYENAWVKLKSYQGRADSDKDDAKGAGNAEQYTYYTAQKQTYKAVVSSYYKMLDSMKKTVSSTSTQRQAERQMTVAAQSLMVSYEALRQQKYTLEKIEELYKTQYELGTVKEQAGTVVTMEVLSFKNQMLAAQASLAEVEANMGSIYNSLCLMAGCEVDGSSQVASTPAVDPSRIGTMNLEKDTVKAIGNNHMLISDRHSLKVDFTSSSNYKLRTVGDGEQKLTPKMKRLYEGAAIKRDALEQIRTGYEKARINKQQADIKYAVGTLSKDEYLMEELDYVQKEADYKTADLVLQQAMDTCDWAVLGIADIE